MSRLASWKQDPNRLLGLRADGRSTLVLLVGLALAAIVPVGCSSERDDALSIIRDLLDRGEYESAKTKVDQLLNESPMLGSAHYLRARIALRQEDPQTALIHLDPARNGGVDTRLIQGILGVVMALDGDSEGAEPFLVEALRDKERPQPEVARALAQIYVNTYRIGAVDPILDRWIRDAPNDPEPHCVRALAEVARDRGAARVIRAYEEALKREPDHVEAGLGLANQLREIGRFTEAAVHYEHVLALEPDNPIVLLRAGQNARELGQRERAVDLINRAVDLRPDDPEFLRIGATIDLVTEQYDRAHERLDRSIEKFPYDPEARYTLGRLLRLEGRVDEAAEQFAIGQRIRRENVVADEYRRELFFNPGDLELRRRIVDWLFEHGRGEEAVQQARLLLEREPHDPETNRRVATYFQERGEHGKANYFRSQIIDEAGRDQDPEQDDDVRRSPGDRSS